MTADAPQRADPGEEQNAGQALPVRRGPVRDALRGHETGREGSSS